MVEQERGGEDSVLGMLGRVAETMVAAVATIATKVWDGLTSDGILAAAGRQGADELGAALKAFPDSIQTQEVGTLFNPTQGEIAADRANDNHFGGHGIYGAYSSYSDESLRRSAADVAEDMTPYQPSQDQGRDQSHGHDAGHSL